MEATENLESNQVVLPSEPQNKKKQSRIRPVIIYPFSQPRSIDGLRVLYEEIKNLQSDDRYIKPVTIINNQTKCRCLRNDTDPDIKNAYETAMSTIVVDNITDRIETWAVDTCAMWLRGLGDAYEKSKNKQAFHDVFWLIPGDFNYSTDEGKKAVKKIREIPENVWMTVSSICLGEIKVPLNSAKQLIDTYGTYGLLYNWFPAEAQGIRKRTNKPRTEFFAISYEFLNSVLIDSRWFAYEQTLMILLQNMNGKMPVRNMYKVDLGKITDAESTRSTLSSAIQQVERTERALKLFWRDKAEREDRRNWQEEFRFLDAQSESIRTAAMVILRRLLS